jgi:hypothetical protein
LEGYDDKGDPLVQGIIGGTAVLTGVGDLSRTGKGLAVAIQNAMSDAVLAANAEGISDPDIIRDRMLAARKQAVMAARQPSSKE